MRPVGGARDGPAGRHGDAAVTDGSAPNPAAVGPRVLLVEDNDVDAMYFAMMLKSAGLGDAAVTRCVHLADFDDHVVGGPDRPDIAFVDLSLPDAAGLDALHHVRLAVGSAPLVVLTGRDDDALAAEAISAGAEDYLVKGHFDAAALERCVRHSVVRATDRADLRRAVSELRASNEELEEYASVVAHDLRAPIRTARVIFDRLNRSETDDAELRSDLSRRMDECLGRLDEMVRALLSYATVRDDGLTLEPAVFGDIAASVLDDLAADLDAIDACVELQGEQTVVHADVTMLARVLRNLLENCVKYRSDAPLRVVIGATTTSEGSVIRVADNGVGIPPEHREQVFGLFERLDATARRDGLGLGLAMCRKVIVAHEGSIAVVDSADGAGTTIEIVVPHAVRDPQLGSSSLAAVAASSLPGG